MSYTLKYEPLIFIINIVYQINSLSMGRYLGARDMQRARGKQNIENKILYCDTMGDFTFRTPS